MDEKVGDDDDANKTSLANLVNVLFIGNFSLIPAVVQSFSYAVIVSSALIESALYSAEQALKKTFFTALCSTVTREHIIYKASLKQFVGTKLLGN